MADGFGKEIVENMTELLQDKEELRKNAIDAAQE